MTMMMIVERYPQIPNTSIIITTAAAVTATTKTITTIIDTATITSNYY
jgi:hypothetical protein